MNIPRRFRSIFWPCAAVGSLALLLACGDHFLTEPGESGESELSLTSTLAEEFSGTLPAEDPGCTDDDCPPDPPCTDDDCGPDPPCTDDDCTWDIQLVIDIKPGSYPNSWGCRAVNGNLPVAVLSTQGFDATDINANTVRFGKTGFYAAPVHTDNDGNVLRHVEDVDEDGLQDMVFHFRFGDTGFVCDDIPPENSDAILMGWLTGEAWGEDLVGWDELRLVR